MVRMARSAVTGRIRQVSDGSVVLSKNSWFSSSLKTALPSSAHCCSQFSSFFEHFRDSLLQRVRLLLLSQFFEHGDVVLTDLLIAVGAGVEVLLVNAQTLFVV